jgi:hypothetical protein
MPDDLSSTGEAASPRFRARVTGAVYLFYFLTAISGQLLVSRAQTTYGLAVNLISEERPPIASELE